MPEGGAQFIGPGGEDPRASIRQTVQALGTVTAGDLLAVGQSIFRPNIRTRTLRGVDVNEAAFTPYSQNGPYYFYLNRDIGLARGPKATPQTKRARKTAAANRFSEIKGKATHYSIPGIGEAAINAKRTPYGIRYPSYAAAKAAHGVGNVNLFGMEQHPHMLDAMMVRAGGMEVSRDAAEFGSDLEAFEQGVQCSEMTVGFYDETAGRARGNNEGAGNLPMRRFFALNAQDLNFGERLIARRMLLRARRGGGALQAPNIAPSTSGPVDISDVGF